MILYDGEKHFGAKANQDKNEEDLSSNPLYQSDSICNTQL